MFKKAVLASAVAAATSVAMAEEKTIEELVVWGAEIKASSLKLDEGDIQLQQSEHLGDLLRIIPGVDVGGAHSLNQRVTIRSLDDKELRISIDGANQNTYMYHHMGNLQIHADILQSIDIDVGNNSVINGGLGGAARFETRDARDLLRSGRDFGARVYAQVSDNANNSASITGYGQLTDKVDALAYFNYVDRDNYTVGGGEIKDQNDEVIPGTDGTVRGLAGELTDGLIKLGWDFVPGHRFKLGYEAYNDEGDYSYRPDMGLATDTTIAAALNVPLLYPTEFTRDTYTVNYTYDNGGATTVKAAVYKNNSTLWRDEHGLVTWFPEYAVINEGEAINTGANILVSTLVDGDISHYFTYGAEIIRHDTSYVVDGLEQSAEDATEQAVFIQDRVEFGFGLSVIPGLRYDQVDVSSVVVQDTFSKPTGALALEYAAGNSWLFVLSGTEIFKAPELAEVFTGAGLYDTPNPDIEAEEGYNAQATVAFEQSGFDAGVTLFQTKIEDYIYDYNRGAPYPKDNVGHMFIEGVEAYAGYTADVWDLLISYSTAESDLEAFADFASLDGARLDTEPGATIGLVANYEIETINVRLYWESQFVDDVPAGTALDSANANAKDAYDIHSVSAQWTPEFAPGLAVTLGVDNLTDEYYAAQASRSGVSNHPRFGELYLMDYEPGRNVKASISYQF